MHEPLGGCDEGLFNFMRRLLSPAISALPKHPTSQDVVLDLHLANHAMQTTHSQHPILLEWLAGNHESFRMRSGVRSARIRICDMIIDVPCYSAFLWPADWSSGFAVHLR